MLFEQHFASRIILFLCCTIIQDCKLLLFTTVLAFIFFFTFCVVIPQRSETVVVCVTCIVHALVMTLLIFFCLDTLFHPAKYKEQLGSKVRPMYSLLPFRLQQCSARDAYCAVCPFYLELRHYIFTAIKDTSSSCQWHGTWWSCQIFLISRLWICWLADLQRLFVDFLFLSIRSVSFCFVLFFLST